MLRFPELRHSVARPTLMALLGMALSVGALGKGLDPDDLAHRTVIQRGLAEGSPRPLWEMYVHIPHSPAGVAVARSSGLLPWWTWAGVHIAFFRPLAALSQCLDYLPGAGSPALMYAHNLLWYGLLCWLVTVLLGRLMACRRTASLAALIFVLDDAHAQNVGWIANRSSLMAAVFGVCCLLAHHSWRRDHWRAGALVAPGCLLLSLLSAEMGITSFALLFAYALCLERGALWRRLLCLLPSLAVLAIWAAVYHWLGFGAHGSGAYISPTGDPVGYTLAFPHRALELMVFLLGVPAPALAAFSGLHALVLGAAALLVTALALLGFSLLRLGRDREIRFCVLVLALSLLPVTASVAHPRLLLFASIPAAALIARLLVRLYRARRLRALALPLAGVLGVVHLAAAPVGLAVGVGPPGVPLSDFARLHVSVLDAVPDLGRSQLVVVNSPDILHGSLISPQRQAMGLPAPAVTFVWSTTRHTVDLTRTDHRTLELTSDHWFAGDPFAVNFRGHAHPLKAGQRFVMRTHVVQVMELLAAGRPRRVRFCFPTDLGRNPSLVLLSWDGRRYRRVNLPAPGRTVRLGASVDRAGDTLATGRSPGPRAAFAAEVGSPRAAQARWAVQAPGPPAARP